MTFATPVIRVYFGLQYASGSQFTLDDPVKGVLDGPYLLAGSDGDGVDVATDGFSVQIRRGRSRELDEFEAGTATVSLRNFDRKYDPLNSGDVDALIDENGDGFVDEDDAMVINPAAPYFGQIEPGKRVEIEMYGQIIFAGTIEDWNLDWSVNGDATATFTAYDMLADLGRREFDEWNTVDGETESERLDAILNRSEVAFGANRDLDEGLATLQTDLVTWGSQVLPYAQLVVKSAQGRLFAARDGTLTYRNRHNLVGAESMVSFTDDGTGTPFHGVSTQTGSEALFNRVGVDRVGGTLQTVSDTASQDEYGIRPFTGLSQLLMDTDIQSADMAEYLLSIYKFPQSRVATITCRLHDDQLESVRGTLAALDIGDVVDMSWRPLDIGTRIEQTLVIEGVDHEISPDGGHYMTLSTAPALQTAVFILDDPVWGVMDTGPGRLAF